MNIMFDLDGVLADFVYGFTALANKNYGTPITPTSGQPSWYGFPGLDTHVIDSTWYTLKQDGTFWVGLPSLVSSDELAYVAALADQHHVYFATDRKGLRVKRQTEEWLEDRGIINPTVLITNRKGEVAKALKCRFSIEDKASNASAVAWLTEDRCKSYLINRPYNQVNKDFMASSVRRVDSIQDYVEVIQDYLEVINERRE